MEISPHTLAQFLYGFDEFFGCRPYSIHPSDYPSFKIHVVHFSIGSQIRNADPDESTFHGQTCSDSGVAWLAQSPNATSSATEGRP